MSIKTADQLEAYFRKLQIEQKGHLGDIKLTIEQQDEVVAALRNVEGLCIKARIKELKQDLDSLCDDVGED